MHTQDAALSVRSTQRSLKTASTHSRTRIERSLAHSDVHSHLCAHTAMSTHNCVRTQRCPSSAACGTRPLAGRPPTPAGHCPATRVVLKTDHVQKRYATILKHTKQKRRSTATLFNRVTALRPFAEINRLHQCTVQIFSISLNR